MASTKAPDKVAAINVHDGHPRCVLFNFSSMDFSSSATLQHRVPPAAIATGVGYDVSTLFSVPTDSLKRVTRERKYAIEELGKCLEASASSSSTTSTQGLLETLRGIRERFGDAYAKEQVCIQKLQARVEYVRENVLEKELELRARRQSRHAANGGTNGLNKDGNSNAGFPSSAHIQSRSVAPGGAIAATPPEQPRQNVSYVDVLVQEYLARQGYTNTLGTLQQQHPKFLPLLIDTEQYEELNRLVESIEERHSCAEVLAWCGKNAVKLKKMRSALMFQLHIQEFVHMLDEGKRGDDGQNGTMTTSISKETKHRAMSYARKYLSPYAETYPDEFQRAAGLLVLRDILPESPSCVELFAERRWHGISSLLRRDYLSIHGMSPTSPLETHLTCGIAALQVSSNEDGVVVNGGGVHAAGNHAGGVPRASPPSSNQQKMLVDNMDNTAPSSSQNKDSGIMHGRVNQQNDDPLRHPVLQKLAASVPSSKRTVSKLVCPVTGIVMEGNNQPIVLPNGYVYGSLAVYEGLLDWRGDDKEDQQRSGDPDRGGAGHPAGHPADGPGTRTTARQRPQGGSLAPTPAASTAQQPSKQIHCPCTGDIFSIDQARKLFIV